MPLFHIVCKPPPLESATPPNLHVFDIQLSHAIKAQNFVLKTACISSNTPLTAIPDGDNLLWLGFNMGVLNTRQVASNVAQGGGLYPVPCSYQADRAATQIVYADTQVHLHEVVESFRVAVYKSDGIMAMPFGHGDTDLKQLDLVFQYDDVEAD
jgi:hypothetical protein